MLLTRPLCPNLGSWHSHTAVLFRLQLLPRGRDKRRTRRLHRRPSSHVPRWLIKLCQKLSIYVLCVVSSQYIKSEIVNIYNGVLFLFRSMVWHQKANTNHQARLAKHRRSLSLLQAMSTKLNNKSIWLHTVDNWHAQVVCKDSRCIHNGLDVIYMQLLLENDQKCHKK